MTLEDRVVLVTGASRGIGYAAAIEAARRGAHVIALARTVGGLEELDDAIKAIGGSATLVPLDIRDGDGIDRLGASIFERWGHLDGLVGNAGVLGVISPVAHLRPADFDTALAVNITANFRLIRSMDLLLRKSTAGRAVFISSSSAKSRRAFWGLYAATKSALDALVAAYAKEMASTPVRANVFYPGAVRTAMRAKAVPGEDPQILPTPAEIAPKLVEMIEPAYAENGVIFDLSTNATSPL